MNRCEIRRWSGRLAFIRGAPAAVLLAFLAIMLCPRTDAAVTTVAWFRLGESDPGASAGVIATNTIDLSDIFPLTITGPATYSSDVSPVASASDESSLSMQFTNSAVATGATIVSSATENFGIECWVKPASTSGTQVIVYNGNTSFSGWGIFIGSSNYMGLFGGTVEFGAGPVVPNVWTHVAVVDDGGVTTLYVNGVPAGFTIAGPNEPTGNFALATHPQIPQGEYFTGEMDEVRIFTFAPGQFSTNDLLLNRSEVVTNLADDGNLGSLRYAVANALSNDVITFAAPATSGTLLLTNGEFVIPTTVDIIGPGTNLILNGNFTNRAFNITSTANVRMSGLGIYNCLATANLNGNGGAIYNAGSLVLSNCSITHCAAMTGAMAIEESGQPGGPGANAGAIYNTGMLSLTACTVANNFAGQGGPGAFLTFDGTNEFLPTAGGTGGNGGGIVNENYMLLFGCSILGNFGGNGGTGGNGFPPEVQNGPQGPGGNCGAIYNDGTATITSCTLDGNSAGIGSALGSYGGIFNDGTITIMTSSISGNNGNSVGGGIYNFSGTVTIESSTISQNFAISGGGILNDSGGTVTIESSTIAQNNAEAYGGGLFNDVGCTTTLLASTVALNSCGIAGGVYNAYDFTARNCLFASNAASMSPDYSGPFSSQGYNLIGNNQGSFGFFAADNDIVGTPEAPINSRITKLAQNGGPTLTMALLSGSPAIDAGDDRLLSDGITTDQRGAPRKSGAHVDIGAYERILGTAPHLSLGISNQVLTVVFTNTPFAAFTILRTTNLTVPLSNWSTIGSPAEISPGQFEFLDPSTSNPQEFYDVRSP